MHGVMPWRAGAALLLVVVGPGRLEPRRRRTDWLTVVTDGTICLLSLQLASASDELLPLQKFLPPECPRHQPDFVAPDPARGNNAWCHYGLCFRVPSAQDP
jgi:hypothetical protein